MTDAVMNAIDEGPKSDLVIAGIGASAGGLQALEDLFRDMPAKPGIAFVVIQHLSPDYKSMMVDLLSRSTVLPVVRAEDGMAVQADHIYLMPPRYNMTVAQGRLHLEAQPAERGVNLPIDIFFRSVATDSQERAVGIVLSGTGSDGTLGTRAIKGAGGLVMVQDPETAKFDGMPRSAIAAKQVDFILPLDQLRTRLLEYVNHPGFDASQSSTAAIATRSALEDALAIVKERYDLDLLVYRRNSMQRRVQKRMQMNQLQDLHAYVDLLRRNPQEVRALYEDVLIGVTRFFRDPEAFEYLRQPISQLLAEREEGELRMWVQACSTGEEAYSMAILVKELMRGGPEVNLKIFATDVDPNALRFASAGVYPDTIAADVPGDLLDRYFRHEGTSYRVRESVRRSVIFSQHNVLRDPPFNRTDIVTCRNFLIYLELPAQQHVLSRFTFSLDKGGLLFLGPSESLGDLAREFDALSHRWKVFRRSTARNPLPLGSQHWAKRKRSSPEARSPGGYPAYPSNVGQDDRRLFRSLMSELAPPSLVLDDAGRVLMTFGPVGRYLSFRPGPVSYDIGSMVDGPLAVVLSTALHRARSGGVRVVYPNVAVSDGEDPHRVNLVVAPLSETPDGAALFGVVFRELGTGGAEEDAEAIRLPPDQTLLDLQHELQYTKESLQATIEELETSNEELQAANEELLASNEELQSTNEELQSVNEELITVNAEFQRKIQELTELNSDLDNFFVSSDISTLFLDSRLKIRKFSPSVAEHFNLLPTDLGRPLQHFNFGLAYPRFFEEARRVMETLEPHEREVRGSEGRFFLVRMLPYRSSDNQVAGLVISFIDTTVHRQRADELVAIRATLEQLTERQRERLGDKPRRVLLVEDDPDQAELLKASLEHSAMPTKVYLAPTGSQALELLVDATEDDTVVDVVLLDLHLPDMSGFDVLDRLKAVPALRAVPVIIISAEDDPAAIRRAYDQHASCFITKPAALEQLPAVLETIKQHWFTVVQLPGDARLPVDPS